MSRLALFMLALMAATAMPALAADVPAAAQASEVPPAAPGVFTAQKRGGARFHLTVAGHALASRDGIEKYLAWRAAELTLDQHAGWFVLVESRAKGDSAPAPKPDPAGPRFSFRMEYWRPAWRYKTPGATAWKSWSPFADKPFFASDPKSVTDFEAGADIVLHKGQVADDNPLAFDAAALADLLVNQVSPPQ